MRKDYIKPLYILITILFVALFVQGYFIYNLQQENITKRSDISLTHNPIYRPGSNTTNSIDPFVEIQKIQEHMMKEFGSFNSMFANDPFFQDAFSNAQFSPKSDIIEKDKEYIVEIKIPGVNEQKIDINSDGNIIHVSAQSQKSTDKNTTNYIHKESFANYFKRSFSMPFDADLDSMKSNYKDGVLKLTIQKTDN